MLPLLKRLVALGVFVVGLPLSVVLSGGLVVKVVETLVSDEGPPIRHALRDFTPAQAVGPFDEFEVSGWYHGIAAEIEVKSEDGKMAWFYAVIHAEKNYATGPHIIFGTNDRDDLEGYLKKVEANKRAVVVQGFRDAWSDYSREVQRDLTARGIALDGPVYYAYPSYPTRAAALRFLWSVEIATRLLLCFGFVCFCIIWRSK